MVLFKMKFQIMSIKPQAHSQDASQILYLYQFDVLELISLAGRTPQLQGLYLQHQQVCRRRRCPQDLQLVWCHQVSHPQKKAQQRHLLLHRVRKPPAGTTRHLRVTHLQHLPLDALPKPTLFSMNKKTFFDRTLKVQHGRGGIKRLQHYHRNSPEHFKTYKNSRTDHKNIKHSQHRQKRSYSKSSQSDRSYDSYDRRSRSRSISRSPSSYERRDRRHSRTNRAYDNYQPYYESYQKEARHHQKSGHRYYPDYHPRNRYQQGPIYMDYRPYQNYREGRFRERRQQQYDRPRHHRREYSPQRREDGGERRGKYSSPRRHYQDQRRTVYDSPDRMNHNEPRRTNYHPVQTKSPGHKYGRSPERYERKSQNEDTYQRRNYPDYRNNYDLKTFQNRGDFRSDQRYGLKDYPATYHRSTYSHPQRDSKHDREGGDVKND